MYKRSGTCPGWCCPSSSSSCLLLPSAGMTPLLGEPLPPLNVFSHFKLPRQSGIQDNDVTLYEKWMLCALESTMQVLLFCCTDIPIKISCTGRYWMHCCTNQCCITIADWKQSQHRSNQKRVRACLARQQASTAWLLVVVCTDPLNERSAAGFWDSSSSSSSPACLDSPLNFFRRPSWSRAHLIQY
jgi:hypothetical protein